MNRGRVNISGTLIMDWLKFYSNGEIVDAKYDCVRDSVEFTISHPEMPEVNEGDNIPIVIGTYVISDGKIDRLPIREENVLR